ncbi:MAG: 4-hydroxy-tetrahydrodipicolinate reductase, partial [Myxococcota bacterium]
SVVSSAVSDPLIRIAGGVVRPGSELAGKRAGDSGPQWSAPERDFVLHTELAAALADCLQVEKRPRRAKMDPCPCSGAGVTTFRRDDRLGSGNGKEKNPPLVVIDFSTAACCVANAKACQEAKVPYLVCTTGLGARQERALHAAAKVIAVMHMPNTSLAANALHLLCQLAARLLPQADIEVCETHHRAKADAPSGTALWLAEGMAQARGWDPAKSVRPHGRQGKRDAREIGIVSLRGGTERGSHTVHLLAEDESLEITQRAVSRAAYARGALRAAGFLAAQPPGRYTSVNYES